MAEEGHGRLLNGLSDNSGESFDQDQSTLNTSINQHAFHILKVEGWFSKLCPYVNFPANWIWKRIQWIQRVVKARLKQSRKEHWEKQERLKEVWEEKGKEIDRWQERHRAQIKEENKKKARKAAADRTLSKVTREIQDATRLIETMLSLQKLRLIRRDAAQKRGDTDLGESRQAFEQKITDMTRLVQAQLECYKEEEAKLKQVIKSEQEETSKKERLVQLENEERKRKEEDEELEVILFGPQEQVTDASPLFPYDRFYKQAEHSLEAFVQIRNEWDMFIVPEETPASSSIPSSWVVPVEPNNSVWAGALT